MKRANEALVGAVVLGAMALAVAGSLWLSGRTGGADDRFVSARFRTIGGLKSGNPVLVQGVQVGRVERVALVEGGWVDVALRIGADARAPDSAVAIIASRTLFGDWAVQLMSLRELPNDPEVIRQVRESRAAGGADWPGATLPDIGQITAQASRIAGDIAKLSSRVDSTFDSTSTSREQLQRILSNADSVSGDLRSIATNIRGLASAASSQQEAVSRLIANTDTILARVAAGQGTLGLLTRDSTLYLEGVRAVQEARRILADMQNNPRKYFSFSVF